MVKYKNITTVIIAIIAAIAAIRMISLGLYPLFDPTEGRYAEIGRKMLETGNFVTPFIEYNVPFWAKPPLSFWMTAISYKIFGVNAFAARLPSFFCMGGILWLIYGFSHCKDRAEGSMTKQSSVSSKERWIAASHSPESSSGSAPRNDVITILILSSMSLFFYLAGGVMTDPSLALGITVTMVSFWRAVVQQEKKWGYGFFIGVIIALLAKGPIGVVLMGMPIFVWVLWQKKWKDLWQWLPWVYGTLLTCALVLPWYVMAEMRTPGFLRYFIIGEHFERFLVKGWKGDLYGAGRAHALGTIWMYGFAGMLPWSLIFLFAPFVKSIRKSLAISTAPDKSRQLYLWLWALTPLVFFTMARNILATYAISALPAFALLLTPVILQFIQEKRGKIFVVALAAFLPVIFVVALFLVNIVPDAKWIKSEEQIIKAYHEQAKDKNIPLVFVDTHSYSQDFYSGGKDIKVALINDIRPYLDKEVYVITPLDFYPHIPADLQKKLAIVTEKNNSVLLHNIP